MRNRTSARRRLLATAAAALVLVGTVWPSLGVPAVEAAPAGAEYTASAAVRPTSLSKLGAGTGAAPPVRVGRSAAVGSWIRWQPARAQRVDHLRITGAGSASRMVSGVVSFSDGSRLAVRSDRTGGVSRSFPERTVRWAKLTITDAPAKQRAVAIVRFAVTRSAAAPVPTAQRLEPRASVLGGGSSRGLTDGSAVSLSRAGSTWEAPSSGRQRVRLTWPRAVEVATVRVAGPATGPGAASGGWLRFSDGSSVQMLPVAAGAATPTVVAFTPRVVTWVTIELVPATVAPIRLREVGASGAGVVSRAGTAGGRVGTVQRASSCAGSTGAAASALRLVCPATGDSVRGIASLVVSAPSGAELVASAVLRSGATARVASARAAGGSARLQVDTRRLPGGPVVVRIAATSVVKPLYVQLFNASNPAASTAQERTAHGKQLVFADEFTAPLSASSTGAGSGYAATKPASWGGSEFGEAVFADPGTHPANLSTVAGQYLRIRATPLAAGEQDATGWGRTSRAGILASASVAGGGFAAQYGYFEARVLAPASPGTWPAFWMMSSDFLRDSERSGNSEIDAVELYGQDSSYSCHSWHDWVGVAGRRGGDVDCVHHLPDWAMTWHTYGVDVAADATRYYIDGRLVSSAPAVKHAEQPFYFMLDLSLGAGWPIDLSGVQGVADLYVDWVHVYV